MQDSRVVCLFCLQQAFSASIHCVESESTTDTDITIKSVNICELLVLLMCVSMEMHSVHTQHSLSSLSISHPSLVHCRFHCLLPNHSLLLSCCSSVVVCYINVVIPSMHMNSPLSLYKPYTHSTPLCTNCHPAHTHPVLSCLYLYQ